MLPHLALTARGLAYCSFVGTILSGMGGIYLTYEFFGGHQGPLGHLTRIFTYAFLFGIGYGLFLGPYFGLVMGVGLGILLSIEFYRVRRHQKLYGSSPLLQSPLFGAARGILYGVASLRLFGGTSSLAFGLLSGLGLFFLYAKGYALTNDFTSQSKIFFSKRRVSASIWRGLVVGLAGGLAGYLGGGLNSTGFGFLIGMTVAIVSFLATVLSPRVEWWLENLPDKHLGVLGVAMILLGLGLQTIPDLVTIFGLPIEGSQDSFRARFRIGP